MFGKLASALKNADTDKLVDAAASGLGKLGVGSSQETQYENKSEKVEKNLGPGGKSRALLIGINYVGQKGELRGCHADVKNVKAYLESTGLFKEYRVLLDDASNSEKPTKANMISAFNWLVKDAKPNDSLFLHYSGHGSYQADTNGDEIDGQDETIVPVDFNSAGMIVDDDLHDMLVKPLPAGCKLTAIFDCCHSGSTMDLPFTYSVTGQNEIVCRDNTREILKAGISIGKRLLAKDTRGAARESFQALSLLKNKDKKPNDEAYQKSLIEKSSDAQILLFSGCKDNQTSADAQIEGSNTGAMSWAFLKVLKENNNPPLTELLKQLRTVLQGKYQQIPQMSTAHQIDVTRTQFSLAHH